MCIIILSLFIPYFYSFLARRRISVCGNLFIKIYIYFYIWNIILPCTKNHVYVWIWWKCAHLVNFKIYIFTPFAIFDARALMVCEKENALSFYEVCSNSAILTSHIINKIKSRSNKIRLCKYYILNLQNNFTAITFTIWINNICIFVEFILYYCLSK